MHGALHQVTQRRVYHLVLLYRVLAFKGVAHDRGFEVIAIALHGDFRAGDTLKVHVKVREGDKERIQIFQGVVISRRGSGTNESFTVRKMSGGIGVERVFPLHSPILDRIEVLRRGRVRRAKLFYLRGLRGKAARIEERREDRPQKKAARSAN